MTKILSECYDFKQMKALMSIFWMFAVPKAGIRSRVCRLVLDIFVAARVHDICDNDGSNVVV